MKVVILCGGLGTRLREETEFRPKPMLPIGNRPILWHIMKIYAHHGHQDFILCLGYKGDVIRDYFRNYEWHTNDMTVTLGAKAEVVRHDTHSEEGWRITLAETGEKTLTAGRIARIRKYIGDDPEFLLTYGDGVGNVDISGAIQFHRKSGKLVTLTAVHPPGRFGELGLSEDGSVTKFNEKPQVEGGWINGGFFVVSTRVFDLLGDCDDVMFEEGPVRELTAREQIGAWRHTGFWQPMDTYQELKLLNRLWDGGNAPWRVW